MLIQFSVTNFKSIREKQTFSMVAAPRLWKKENTFKAEVSGEKLPSLLKVAAIYGPNASGKSNLLRAFECVSIIAKLKPSSESQVLPFIPFRFDTELAKEPSRIEVDFIQHNMRYEFVIAATHERVIEEKLTCFPKGKETLLYSRKYSEEKETYTLGDELEGSEELHEVWMNVTGPQVLFISQAVANSKSELTQLRIPFSWINGSTAVATSDWRGLARVTQDLVRSNKYISEKLSEFLNELDVPVSKIEVQNLSEPLLADSSDSDEKLLDTIQGNIKKGNKTTLTHFTALGEAKFDFGEESEGTQNLIGFFLPWFVMGSISDKQLRTLLVDELDSSLHPAIVASLVKKHLQIESNAQLIFTTHDTHLMDTKLMRRDQFWVTERDKNGATQLRSIHDFEGRESEDLEKRYYEGRYRGLPIVSKS